MSIHRSLKTKPTALNQHRNVLSRNERISMLMENDKFDPSTDSPMSLPKVASRRVAAVKKKKAATEEGAEATTTVEPKKAAAGESKKKKK